jgi:hypothetical protein
MAFQEASYDQNSVFGAEFVAMKIGMESVRGRILSPRPAAKIKA